MNLVNELVEEGWLRTPRIIGAFRKVKRGDFLPDDKKDLAELNEALPIGFSQTISQPLTVAFMLELLQPKADDKILDIGSGSGWTSALLSEIVGENGRIIAVEIVPELKKIGEKNAQNYNKNKTAEFILGDGSKGFKKQAPYDKILVSASIDEKIIPKAWKEQLKIGGRIVCPIENSIWLFVKKTENDFEEKEYPGFIFVPLISK